MKKILSSIFLIVLLVITPTYVYSQSTGTPEENDSSENTEADVVTNPFDIEIVTGTQSPWTKRVPLTIRFTPNVSSDRVQLTWDTPSGVQVGSYNTDFFAVQAGAQYELQASVKPLQSGAYSIAATLTDWGYSTNRASTEDIVIAFGEDLVTDPVTGGYQNASLIRYIVLLGVTIILFIALFIGGKKGLKLLKEWLKPPE